MLLVYTHKTTSRFKYIADFILIDLCGFELTYTNDLPEFTAYTGSKLNYSEGNFDNAVHVIPFTLLFEKGIKQQSISVSSWNNIPVLFKNAAREVPFDIFSASFYLLSRYEEYLPHITD